MFYDVILIFLFANELYFYSLILWWKSEFKRNLIKPNICENNKYYTYTNLDFCLF